MRSDSLARLIEAAEPDQLRRLARLVLRLSGYADSRITDGPYDGGADLRVLAADGSELPEGIAVSVEQKWENKLRGDAAKAKGKLGLSRLLFISSRRIPEGTFRPVQRDLQDKLGVHVDRIDQQAIADIVLDNGVLSDVLAIFEISLPTNVQPKEPSDRRRDAAFAYAFFSPDVRSFRDVVREKSLLTALAHAGGAAKIDVLCADAARLLGSSADAAAHFLPVIDRLRRQGHVQGVNGSVTLSPEMRSTYAGLRALREQEEAALRAQLRPLLLKNGLPAPDDLLDTVLRNLGALILRHVGGSDALEDLGAQLRLFRRELEAHGLHRDSRGDALLQELLDVARFSELGRTLAMGTLYRALTNLKQDALLAALDARSLALVLDASVAIPMFCALFRRPVRQRFFVVARELHRCARRLGFPLQLPAVWLEEMASHLLNARHYRTLIKARVNDLRLSQNAYVAYFVNERNERGEGDFDAFLASFGLQKAVEARASGDFEGARRTLENFLRQQLARYDITVIETPLHGAALASVEKAWDWARHELKVERRDTMLERHDKTVLAWLASRATDDPTHAPLIVTWDRLLRHVQPEGTPGGALDPLALGELLAFVGEEDRPSLTAEFAGLWIGEREAEKNAQVLDTLIKFAREDMSDAEVVQKVHEFRAQWLAEHHDVADVAALERAWHKFRGE
ncbi:hypothetical protein [Nannocystis pusilla]|uniref:Restriction endonuclease type IV Mrr domain-containing protein n=1 Tax=Nannocystis pusilla TaxID=889268 RepID=A0ABS7TRM1_9BACT|nr:hypothetical protein [Nannocystis pusilla]MBZ5710892.1 hypothetical protein [Nannocystis pusilla]